MVNRVLHLDVSASNKSDGKLELVERFRLFSFGVNETSQGPISLTEAGAKAVMQRYEKRTKAREGWLDIDWFHLSRKHDARLEDRLSAGRCKLELVPGEGGGIDVVQITPTARARQALEDDEVRSYSPVVMVDAKGALISIEQLSLTNIPAMDDAKLIAAEDVLPEDSHMLSVTPEHKYPIYEGINWDGKAADQRIREFMSYDKSGDLDKLDMVKYRKAFMFFDGEAPEAVSRYKGQILDVQDVGNGPEIVISKKAVQTLGAILQGSRGGINISDSDREKGKAILARYYKRFGAVAPWDREENQMEGKTTPRVQLQLESAKWNNETKKMLGQALAYRFGEHAYIDDFSSDKLRICVYSEGAAPAKYYELPYTMENERAVLGEAVEVVQTFVAKASANDLMAMQDKLVTAHERLLEVTGKESTSEALVMLEALKRDATKTIELEAKLKGLEDRDFQRERSVMLDRAKRDGKWTLALEQQCDTYASMAYRLGESRVAALESFWGSAPVVIAPGGAQQPPVKQVSLSEDEEIAAQAVAKMTGKAVEIIRQSMLEQKTK